MKFIVDSNVGKLAKWLRIAGFDTLFLKGIDDNKLIRIALQENRVLLTKDTQIMRRRLVANGQIKLILTQSDDPKEQLQQVVKELKLDCRLKQFTRCLECNQKLVPKSKEEIKGLVPPYVFRTHAQYMQCPACLRVYWQGTHWQQMKKELEAFASDSAGEQK